MTGRSELRKRFWDGLPELRAVPGELRDPLKDSWLHAAQMEHASIASFGQLALQLLSLGAPADLVEQAHVAALDEIEHARICFALASAYGGRRCGPGALDAAAESSVLELEALVCANVEEGCVGETLAALEAKEAARRAEDPVVSAALQAVAFDEERHAQLGWSVWGWALAMAPELRAPTAAVFDGAIAQTRRGMPNDLRGKELEAHGRLANSTRRELAIRHIEEVLLPAREQLLSGLSG